MIESIIGLFNTLVFEVATFRRLPDEAISRRPASWLFEEFERVAEARWRETVTQILAVEIGAGRALVQALGGKQLPSLPDYENLLAHQEPLEKRLPAWHYRFEQANPDKVKRRGREGPDDEKGR